MKFAVFTASLAPSSVVGIQLAADSVAHDGVRELDLQGVLQVLNDVETGFKNTVDVPSGVFNNQEDLHDKNCEDICNFLTRGFDALPVIRPYTYVEKFDDEAREDARRSASGSLWFYNRGGLPKSQHVLDMGRYNSAFIKAAAAGLEALVDCGRIDKAAERYILDSFEDMRHRFYCLKIEPFGISDFPQAVNEGLQLRQLYDDLSDCSSDQLDADLSDGNTDQLAADSAERRFLRQVDLPEVLQVLKKVETGGFNNIWRLNKPLKEFYKRMTSAMPVAVSVDAPEWQKDQAQKEAHSRRLNPSALLWFYNKHTAPEYNQAFVRAVGAGLQALVNGDVMDKVFARRRLSELKIKQRELDLEGAAFRWNHIYWMTCPWHKFGDEWEAEATVSHPVREVDLKEALQVLKEVEHGFPMVDIQNAKTPYDVFKGMIHAMPVAVSADASEEEKVEARKKAHADSTSGLLWFYNQEDVAEYNSAVVSTMDAGLQALSNAGRMDEFVVRKILEEFKNKQADLDERGAVFPTCSLSLLKNITEPCLDDGKFGYCECDSLLSIRTWSDFNSEFRSVGEWSDERDDLP